MHRKRLAAALLLFVGVLVVHALSPVRTPADSRGTVPQAYAFAQHGTLDVSTVMPEEIWGADYVYLPKGDGTVPRYPVGPALLAVPVVVVADALGYEVEQHVAEGSTFGGLEALLASALVAASTAVLFLIASRELRRITPAVLLAVAFAFGTTVWSDASRSMWQHAPLMLAVLLALWCLPPPAGAPAVVTPSDRVVDLRLLGTGALLGAGLWFRPVAVVPLVVVMAWAILRHRTRGLWLVGGAAAPVVGLAAVNHALHGTWSPVFYHQSSDFSFGSLWDGVAANLFSPSRGALLFEPVLFLVVASVVVGVRRRTFRDLEWIALVSAAGVFASVASNPGWWGGYGYGPRLLTDLVPLVAVACIPLADCWPKDLRQLTLARVGLLALVVALFAWSVGVNALGALSFATWEWNYDPASVDDDPDRAWDWSDPQFLRGTPFAGYERAGPITAP